MDREAFFQKQCEAYFDGLMTPEEAEGFLKAVGNHSARQKAFEQLQTVHQRLQRYVEIEPPSALEGKIRHAILLESRTASNVLLLKPPKKKRQSNLTLRTVAAAVMFVALVGVVFQFQPWSVSPPSPETASNPPRVVLKQHIAEVHPVGKTVKPQEGTVKAMGISSSKVKAVPSPRNHPLVPAPPVELETAEAVRLETDLQHTWEDISELDDQMAAMEDETLLWFPAEPKDVNP
jgi:hypothetical protein